MVTVAYNAYCAISMEGDNDTYDGKTAGSRSWEVEATVNSLVGTLFHVIITRMGTDLIFLSRLGSTICFTNFGSHDPIVLYWNPWYTEPCYKGSLLYCCATTSPSPTMMYTPLYTLGSCFAGVLVPVDFTLILQGFESSIEWLKIASSMELSSLLLCNALVIGPYRLVHRRNNGQMWNLYLWNYCTNLIQIRFIQISLP